jgi:hypothetical protein
VFKLIILNKIIMKKIYILAVALVFTSASFAQVSESASNAQLTQTESLSAKNLFSKAATDTIGWTTASTDFLPVFAVGNSVTSYGYSGGGSVYGNNISANDIDVCGQGYDNINNASFGVEGILVLFYRKDEVTGNGTADFQLWSAAPNMANGNTSGSFALDEIGPNVLIESVTVPITAIDTNFLAFTYGQFPSLGMVAGTDFTAVVNMDNIEGASDTAGIQSDQLLEGYRQALHFVGVTGEWYVTNDLFGGALDNNIAIFPVMGTGVGVEDHDFYNNMQLSAYPNPAVNEANIAYNLNEDMKNVTLVVYDMTGKEVYNENYGNQVKGSYKVSLDMTDYTSGNYFYSLVGNGNRFTKKMVVVK